MRSSVTYRPTAGGGGGKGQVARGIMNASKVGCNIVRVNVALDTAANKAESLAITAATTPAACAWLKQLNLVKLPILTSVPATIAILQLQSPHCIALRANAILLIEPLSLKPRTWMSKITLATKVPSGTNSSTFLTSHFTGCLNSCSSRRIESYLISGSAT